MRSKIIGPAPKFGHFWASKNDQIEAVGPKLLNALYELGTNKGETLNDLIPDYYKVDMPVIGVDQLKIVEEKKEIVTGQVSSGAYTLPKFNLNADVGAVNQSSWW